MNVFIQHSKSSDYWSVRSRWTPHLDEALDFGEVSRALSCIRDNALEHSKVLVQSPTASYDIHVNLAEGDTKVVKR